MPTAFRFLSLNLIASLLCVSTGVSIARDEVSSAPREADRASAAQRAEQLVREQPAVAAPLSPESAASRPLQAEHNPSLREDVRASRRRSAALAERLQPLSSTEREELRQLVRELHVPRVHPKPPVN